MGSWIAWGISTLLLLFLNRRDEENEEETTSQQPSKFTETNVNNIGNPVPVVLGRCLIKNPLISYYGSFRADPYTEEYGMHSELNVWPYILAKLIAGLISCFLPTSHTVVGAGGGTAIDTENGARNNLIALAIEAVLLWLLSKLFNDNEGRTTIQKGFKYYLGWQHIICWTGDNIGIKRIWMNVYDSEVEDSTEIGVWDNDSHVAWEADNMNGIVAHIENDEMFGGVDEGGGFIGDVRIYFGNDTQPKDSWMITQMSDSSTIPPELLGLTPKYPMYLTCVVSDSNRQDGAYIGKQSTVPEMWFEVVNFPDTLKKYAADLIYQKFIYRLEDQFAKVLNLVNSMTPDVIDFMQPYMDAIRDAYFDWRDGGGTTLADIANLVKNARAVYPGDNLADFLYLTEYLLYLLEHGIWNVSFIGEDANPAAVIYEILTNKMWGCGYDVERIDIDSLVEMGIECEEEELGISCLINRVSQANEYIIKILRHINGVKFDNPFTGKLTFKLIRNDYDMDKIKVFNTSNCESCEFSRLDWSETTSAVSVHFIDAENKYDESQYLETDAANRLITKNYTETSVDGEYFTTIENAKWLAQVTLRSSGYPLSAISLVTNRYAYDLLIGDPIKVFWEPYGITQMIFRVTDIDYSNINDGRIKVTAIEDVFSFDKIHYHYSTPPAWIDPEHEPEDALFHRYEEMPFELTMSLDTSVHCFAAQPSDDTLYLNVWRYV